MSDYPRYVNWDPQTMETDEAKKNVAAFTADGRLVALHDDTHPDHRQAWADYMMCLDKGDIISRYQLSLDQHASEMRRWLGHYDREVARLRSTVGAAGRWWNICIKARRSRKTIRLDQMPTPGGES
ncbi:hypothetical protein SEA_PHABULOSO_87 [Gordonia phage Phabuloso]|nr:hypothetical protein SEA_PHABULOSO_87 [Gordonia phage Phabuloso]